MPDSRLPPDARRPGRSSLLLCSPGSPLPARRTQDSPGRRALLAQHRPPEPCALSLRTPSSPCEDPSGELGQAAPHGQRKRKRKILREPSPDPSEWQKVPITVSEGICHQHTMRAGGLGTEPGPPDAGCWHRTPPPPAPGRSGAEEGCSRSQALAGLTPVPSSLKTRGAGPTSPP